MGFFSGKTSASEMLVPSALLRPGAGVVTVNDAVPRTAARRSTDPVEDAVPPGFERALPERKFQVGDVVIAPDYYAGPHAVVISGAMWHRDFSRWEYELRVDSEVDDDEIFCVPEVLISIAPKHDDTPPKFELGDRVVRRSDDDKQPRKPMAEVIRHRLNRQTGEHEYNLAYRNGSAALDVFDDNYMRRNDYIPQSRLVAFEEMRPELPSFEMAPVRCDKCGREGAYTPRYQRLTRQSTLSEHRAFLTYRPPSGGDYLLWECGWCGYGEFGTRCADDPAE